MISEWKRKREERQGPEFVADNTLQHSMVRERERQSQIGLCIFGQSHSFYVYNERITIKL